MPHARCVGGVVGSSVYEWLRLRYNRAAFRERYLPQSVQQAFSLGVVRSHTK